MCRLYLNKAIKLTSKGRPHKVATFAKGLLGSQALFFPDQTRPPPKALLSAVSGVFAGQAGLRVEDVLIPSLPNHLPAAVSPPPLLKDSPLMSLYLSANWVSFSKDVVSVLRGLTILVRIKHFPG